MVVRFLLKTSLVLLAVFLVLEFYYQLHYRLSSGVPNFQRVYDFKYLDEEGTPRFPPSLSAWHISYGDRPDVRISINSHGFRGPEPLASPSARVAMIGDSMVFNGAVELAESFPYLTEASLRRDLQDPGIEVLNFGVGDTGLRQYYLKLKNQAFSFHPDLVVLFIYLNDSIDVAGYSRELVRSIHNPWYHSFAAENLLRVGRNIHLLYQAQRSERFGWVETFASRSYLHEDGAWEKMLAAARFDWGAAWHEESWNGIEAELGKIRSVTEAQGAGLLLVVLPVKPQLELPDSTPRLYVPQEFARRTAERLNLPLLDPLPYLRSLRDANNLIYDQCHFTAAGNKAVAEYLTPHLEALLKRPLSHKAQGSLPQLAR